MGTFKPFQPQQQTTTFQQVQTQPQQNAFKPVQATTSFNQQQSTFQPQNTLQFKPMQATSTMQTTSATGQTSAFKPLAGSSTQVNAKGDAVQTWVLSSGYEVPLNDTTQTFMMGMNASSLQIEQNLEDKLKELKRQKVENIKVYQQMRKRIVDAKEQGGKSNDLDSEHMKLVREENADTFKKYLQQLKERRQNLNGAGAPSIQFLNQPALGNDFLAVKSLAELSAD